MKKLYFLLLTILISGAAFGQGPIITGIVDGDCSGGNPKLLEIYADGTVDFSLYSLENQTNANTTWGSTQDLSALGMVANSFVYITTTGSETAIGTDFPSINFNGSNVLTTGTMNVNGDDRLRIIRNSDMAVIDQFGAEGVDGTGMSWEYLDSWAKRNNMTGPDGGFTEANWTFGGGGALDGLGICQAGADTFETLIGGIGTYVGSGGSCGVGLGAVTYTCTSNTAGDDNDTVVINIAYSGSNAGITDVTTTSGGTVGGDDPETVADGTITISGLSEGSAWDITLVGGSCDGTMTSGTVPSAECDPTPNTCFDISTGGELFELVTVTTNSDMDEWSESGGTYSMNGFCGGGCQELVDTWLIFGPLDMTSVSDLNLLMDATENFGDTDLTVNYTSNYTGCPSGTSWTLAQTISDPGAIDVDLSAASGTDVFIGIQYLDDGLDGYSDWDLSNVELAAFGTCPSLGSRPTSDCGICDITLQTENYVCLSNNAGADNDNVTVEIPYTGVDGTITDVTTTSGGVVGGDDPETVTDGTITITGLSEGDAWDIMLVGGDCDGTMLSGTIPSTQCDPTFLIINEVLADPDAASGDANGDGMVDTSDDEFVEIYNSDTNSIDLENYTIEDAVGLRHTFPASSVVPAGGFITVFGGGTPTGINGVAQVSSGGFLGFNNGGDTVTLRNSGGTIVAQFTYGGEGGDNQSLAREPDFTGSFVQHSTIASNSVLFSPGELNEGTLSLDDATLNEIKLYPNPNGIGVLNISIANGDAIKVAVFDMLGKQILTQDVLNKQVDVSALSSGLYLINITQGTSSVTKKLIIE